MNIKRKTRHFISGLLTFALTGCFAVFVLMAVFHFGVFSQSVLTRSFEQSGYYKRQCEAIAQKVRRYMEEADLPEGILDPFGYAPALERSMRSQVYGRNDAVLELNPLSLAEDLLGNLSEQGMEPTIHAGEGILKLSEQIGGLFGTGAKIPGIAQWRQEKQEFTEKLFGFAVVLTALTVLSLVVLYGIQSKKYKFFYYLSLSVILASAAGLLGSTGMFWFDKGMALDTGAGWSDQGVTSWYRKEILLTGIRISAGIFLVGITDLLWGLILKRNVSKE